MSDRVDRVLISLPDGRWIALEPEALKVALAAGAAIIGTKPAPDDAEGEPLMDVEELAGYLKLPMTWIEEAARSKRIPSIQAGRWRRFSRRAVERALTAPVMNA
jgi:excisionase family DNA binding protein